MKNQHLTSHCERCTARHSVKRVAIGLRVRLTKALEQARVERRAASGAARAGRTRRIDVVLIVVVVVVVSVVRVVVEFVDGNTAASIAVVIECMRA